MMPCLYWDFQTALTWCFLTMFVEEVERGRQAKQKPRYRLKIYFHCTAPLFLKRRASLQLSLASSVPGHVSAGAKIEQPHLFDIQFQKTDAAEATGYSFSGSKW